MYRFSLKKLLNNIETALCTIGFFYAVGSLGAWEQNNITFVQLLLQLFVATVMMYPKLKLLTEQ